MDKIPMDIQSKTNQVNKIYQQLLKKDQKPNMKIIHTMILSICLLGCSQIETNRETKTETVRIIDQGSSIPGVVKIAQNEVSGIFIDENGNSTGIVAVVQDVEGDILVGPKRYKELLHWEAVLSKLLNDHPELRNEVSNGN
jgi:hypothetical protein